MKAVHLSVFPAYTELAVYLEEHEIAPDFSRGGEPAPMLTGPLYVVTRIYPDGGVSQFVSPSAPNMATDQVVIEF